MNNKIIVSIFALICVISYLIFINHTSVNKNIEAFKNSDVLICHKTLIITDSNWKLVGEHLINNNSAGYLLIEKCKIKKD